LDGDNNRFKDGWDDETQRLTGKGKKGGKQNPLRRTLLRHGRALESRTKAKKRTRQGGLRWKLQMNCDEEVGLETTNREKFVESGTKGLVRDSDY